MTPEERAADCLKFGDDTRYIMGTPALGPIGRNAPIDVEKRIADAIRAGVAEEREAHSELVAAAYDAVDTFGNGGAMGGSISRLMQAAAKARSRSD